MNILNPIWTLVKRARFQTLLLQSRAWNLLVRYIDGPQEAPMKGKYYVRTGSCNGCGKCCTDIYLCKGDKAIHSEEEFLQLQEIQPDFLHFKPIGKDEKGLIFQCINLQEDMSCGIYENRPLLCRQYPGERSMLMGSSLPQECGYQFHLLKTFNDVLSEKSGQKGLEGLLPFDKQQAIRGSAPDEEQPFRLESRTKQCLP